MKRVGLVLLLLTGMGTGVLLGYLAGQGRIPVPNSVAAALPAILTDILPMAGRPAAAEPIELSEYEFQLGQTEVKRGDDVELAVRLVHKPTGKTAPGVVIYATRFDMAPAGMPTMTAPLERLPADDPGLYRFKTDVAMEGDWRLSVAAKVQGETGTAIGKLDVKAVP